MGVRGGNAPSGLRRREARTIFLRVPSRDWAAIMQGAKTEFRVPHMGAPMESLLVPTPVVIYATSGGSMPKSKLVVLAEHRRERLMDIAEDPQALMREGVENYDSFRTYWRRRTRRPYRPMDKVEVFRVAPWLPPDRVRLGALLIDRLYGEHMPDVDK